MLQDLKDRLINLHQDKLAVALRGEDLFPLPLSKEEVKDLCEFLDTFLYA